MDVAGYINGLSLTIDNNAGIGGTLNVNGNTTLASTDIGGGYGSTGVTISAAGAVSADDSITSDTSFITGTTTLSDGSLVDSSGSITIDSNDGAINLNLGGGVGDDLLVDTNTLVVESDNNRVGVLNTAPSTEFDVTGTINGSALSIVNNTTIGGTLDVTGNSTQTSIDIGGGYGSTVVTIPAAGPVSADDLLLLILALSLALLR